MKVYLDTSSIKFLMRPENERVLEMLLRLPSSVQFIYSYAHLLDFSSDKTDLKYKDLEFMGKLCKDNFLIKFGNREDISIPNVYPRDAFEEYLDVLSSEDLESIFNGDFWDSDPLIAAVLRPLKGAVLISKQNFKGLSEKEKELLELLIPTDKDVTFSDILQKLGKLYSSFNSGKKEYVQMRDFIRAHTNEYGQLLNGAELLSDKPKDTIESKLRNDYIGLDLAGVSADKPKPNIFNSLTKDSSHLYYAAHCDCLISSDTALLGKATKVYMKRGVPTEVIHTDDMEAFLGQQLFPIHSIRDLNAILTLTLRTQFCRLNDEVGDTTGYLAQLKISQRILGYFNTLKLLGRDFIRLEKKLSEEFDYTLWSELAGIVNESVALFGVDCFGKGLYNTEVESVEFVNNRWPGRIWFNGDFWSMLLMQNGRLSLDILIIQSE